MWQFFIVPCRKEREEKGISLSAVMNSFYELRKINPNIKILFSDTSERIGDEE